MTADELQEQLEETRLRTLEAIAELPDEALWEPGALPTGWSIREFLFLLTAWEAELVTALMKIEQGQRPARLLSALSQRSQYETDRLEENAERDLDQIFDDLQGVRVELEDWLTRFTDRQLNDSRRYGWLPGRALAELVAETTFAFEERYAPDIERFAERYQQTPRISLDSVEVKNGHNEA